MGEQIAEARSEVGAGSSLAVATIGVTVNSAAIIGSVTLSELAVDAAVGATFGGPIGAVAGVAVGIAVGYVGETYLTPTSTGEFVSQQMNDLYGEVDPLAGGM